jgi:hypothetical protein
MKHLKEGAMDSTTTSTDDARTLATKLATFYETLTPGEQQLFNSLETQLATLTTTGEGDDVEGYMMPGWGGYDAAAAQHPTITDALREAESGRPRAPRRTPTTEQRTGFWQTLLGRTSDTTTTTRTGGETSSG